MTANRILAVIYIGRNLKIHRQIANSELAIIPGVHGEYIGEITTTNHQ